jgi:hypothetical protein
MTETSAQTRWRRLPELDGPVLAARYNSGESLRSIAGSTTLSYGTVYRRLAEHGVTFRGRGGWHPAPSSPRPGRVS